MARSPFRSAFRRSANCTCPACRVPRRSYAWRTHAALVVAIALSGSFLFFDVLQ